MEDGKLKIRLNRLSVLWGLDSADLVASSVVYSCAPWSGCLASLRPRCLVYKMLTRTVPSFWDRFLGFNEIEHRKYSVGINNAGNNSCLLVLWSQRRDDGCDSVSPFLRKGGTFWNILACLAPLQGCTGVSYVETGMGDETVEFFASGRFWRC